jgi:hypothetical protein
VKVYKEIKGQLMLKSMIEKLVSSIWKKIVKIAESLRNLDDRGVERLIWIGIVMVSLLLYYFLNRSKK